MQLDLPTYLKIWRHIWMLPYCFLFQFPFPMSARGLAQKSNNEKKSSKYVLCTVLFVAKESESTQIFLWKQHLYERRKTWYITIFWMISIWYLHSVKHISTFLSSFSLQLRLGNKAIKWQMWVKRSWIKRKL